MTVKVGDFGLSRDLYEGDYYMMKDSSTPLPLRWVAIESILTSKFSIKSDVVSVNAGINWLLGRRRVRE